MVSVSPAYHKESIAGQVKDFGHPPKSIREPLKDLYDVTLSH